MPPTLRPPARARVRNPDTFGAAVATEVRGHMAFLGSQGWTLWDIAAALDCSRTALVSWRNGAADMPARMLLKLRHVTAERARKAG